jgi:hypothetical protein
MERRHLEDRLLRPEAQDLDDYATSCDEEPADHDEQVVSLTRIDMAPGTPRVGSVSPS